MKEFSQLSIEQKAEAYDEAIARANELLYVSDKDSLQYHNVVHIFPELKESEDEKIRETLIENFKWFCGDYHETTKWGKEDNLLVKDIIAWLEKQGEKEQLYIRFGEIPTDEKSKIYQGEIEVGTENGVSVYPAFKTGEGNIVLGLNLPITKTSLHTQQHLIEYDDRPCYLVKGDYVGKDTDGQPLINNVSIIEKIDSYRVKKEKQGENHDDKYNITGIKSKHAEGKFGEMIKEIKSTDKVEPKFKQGQWIVWQDKCYKVSYNGCGYELTDQNGESTSLEYGAVDKTANLWRIQDAKAGDVLYSPKDSVVECIVLIGGWKQLDGDSSLCAAITYRVKENEIKDEYPGAIWWSGKINSFYPATKLQRDILFQKMKEAGYVYDAEKKQLRKMEHDKSKFQILKDTWYVCTCTTCTEDSRIWFNNGTAYLGSEILKYDLGFEPEEYQNYFRLWTIKDAKDGDILASKSGNKIFSYRGNLDLRGNPCAYYGIYKVHDGICFSPCAIGNSFTCEEVFPATKEQRKILFEERIAAGGVLHFSKKELKKIEDEIEIPYGAKDSELQEATYYIPKGFHAEIDGDKVVVKKGEKPTEWSEEDEKLLNDAISLSDECDDIELRDWLKSLRYKVGCKANYTTTKKWSEEDEKNLQGIIDEIEANKNQAPDYDLATYDRFLSWLKSL